MKDIVVPPHLQDYDDILRLLADKKEGLTFDDIHHQVVNMSVKELVFDKDDGTTAWFTDDTKTDSKTIIGKSLIFLAQEKYIEQTSPKYFIIRQEGIDILNRGGFVKQYIEQQDFKNFEIQLKQSTLSTNRKTFIIGVLTVSALFIQVWLDFNNNKKNNLIQELIQDRQLMQVMLDLKQNTIDSLTSPYLQKNHTDTPKNQVIKQEKDN